MLPPETQNAAQQSGRDQWEGSDRPLAGGRVARRTTRAGAIRRDVPANPPRESTRIAGGISVQGGVDRQKQHGCLTVLGGGAPKCAANQGLTPSFRRGLPETGCLSQGLPAGY